MSYDELPTTAGMKSLHCKRLTQALILLFKMHRMGPPYRGNLFKNRHTPYGLRGEGSTLELPNFNLKLKKKKWKMKRYHLLAVITIDLIYTRSYFERVPSSCLFPTNADKVFSLMNKIRKSKPTGLDRISVRLIWECTDLICVPICDLFNHSFRRGKLPEDCKSVRVAPLFKQDDRDNVNSLLPVSVIPVVVGVLENSIRTIKCLFRGER